MMPAMYVWVVTRTQKVKISAPYPSEALIEASEPEVQWEIESVTVTKG